MAFVQVGIERGMNSCEVYLSVIDHLKEWKVLSVHNLCNISSTIINK